MPEKLERMTLAWQEIRAEIRANKRAEPQRARTESDSFLQPACEEAKERLHRGAHSLAGSGASFGFAELSVAARELEVYLQEVLDRGTEFNPLEMEQVELLLATLHQAAHKGKIGAPRLTAEQTEHDGAAQVSVVAPQTSVTQSRVDTQYEERGKVVLLLEKDGELARDLAAQISYFGYQVRVLDRCGDLQQAFEQFAPIAVITDIGDTDDIDEDPAYIRSLTRVHEARDVCDAETQRNTSPLRPVPPVIFLSARDDIITRLQAVRLGGAAYFTKPVGVDRIVSKLDELVSPQASDPFRILVIDDEPELAAYHASMLESADMLTTVISDPMLALTALLESKPDLILMDMHMPGCTGVELAGVIRQQEAYVSVPIVYLSAETNVDKQLAAMRLGGDSFLTKPIRPDHLISAVRGRVERLRVLRSFMVRDSLTGLLNHTVIKEQLALEVARTVRVGREGREMDMCFALIDIDHFKLVNDTYGHMTGDRVIKSISRLLKQRLRKSDMVGRYGGEEFAIILPNTAEAGAAKLLDELRDGFSQVRHQSEEREFYVTFSAGVAQLSAQFADAGQLSSAADRALYEAKAQGRNCVAIATPFSPRSLHSQGFEG